MDPNSYCVFQRTKDGKLKIKEFSFIPEKIGKAKVDGETEIEWALKQLQNPDAFFQLDFGVKLLYNFLRTLIELKRTSPQKVERFLNNCKGDLSIEDVINTLTKN